MLAWWKRLVGSGRSYAGDGYVVGLKRGVREGVNVQYQRDALSLELPGEFYGKPWKCVAVMIPKEVAAGEVSRLVADLKEALGKLGYGYTISRGRDPQEVSEEERRQALADLRSMGMKATLDGDRVVTTRLPGFKPPPKEAAVAYGLRMMQLMRTISGQKVPVDVLAQAEPPQK